MERPPCALCAGSGECWVCEGTGITPVSRRACTSCTATGRCHECAGTGTAAARRPRERRGATRSRFTADQHRWAATFLRDAQAALSTPRQRRLAEELAQEFERWAREGDDDGSDA